MSNLKRIVSFFVALIMVFAFAGCSKEEPDKKTTRESEQMSPQEEAEDVIEDFIKAVEEEDSDTIYNKIISACDASEMEDYEIYEYVSSFMLENRERFGGDAFDLRLEITKTTELDQYQLDEINMKYDNIFGEDSYDITEGYTVDYNLSYIDTSVGGGGADSCTAIVVNENGDWVYFMDGVFFRYASPF